MIEVVVLVVLVLVKRMGLWEIEETDEAWNR